MILPIFMSSPLMNCLKNAIQDGVPLDDLFYDDDSDNAAFWLQDFDYYHNQTVTRCVYAAIQGLPSTSSDIHTPGLLSVNRTALVDANMIDCYVVHEIELLASGSPHTHLPSVADYESIRPFFAWLSTDTIRETFSNSTQYGFMPHSPDGNLFK